MSKHDLLNLAPLPLEEIEWLIDRARHYKNKSKPPIEAESHLLQGHSIGLLFEKPSTRTRVSFEAAIVKLGGHPVFLSSNDLQIKRGESIADSARVLGSYLDGLIIRTHRHEQLEEWAHFSAVPVINGLSDLYHPCQILTDLFTIFERLGRLRGLNLGFIGDGNNIAHSLMEGGAKVGMNVTIASPLGFMPNPDIVKKVEEIAKENEAKIVITNDPKVASKNADIIYTDVWISMGDEQQEEIRKEKFKLYQINQSVIGLCRPDIIVMHCLPAHRGEEITSDVIEGKHSIVFEQAANRLPMQQAILERFVCKKAIKY